VRTSEATHAGCVAQLWRQLAAAGHIRRGEHAGWCVRKHSQSHIGFYAAGAVLN
jgi:methionyl-tRNA synthetase